jgi:hypothetical protein
MHELREHERVFVDEYPCHREATTMTDHDLARFISENSLAFIERRRWRLFEVAREYLDAERTRRQAGYGITWESYEAWQSFVSELGF